MGFIGAILGALGGISTVLFIVEVLRYGETPLISDKFGEMFWMYLAGLLFLGAIVCLLGRKHSPGD
jgi:membrane associated rhomboid family serine protease